MEIVDNNEEKKSLFSNKMVIAAVSAVVALLTICMGVFAFTDAGKADEVNVNSSDGVESVAFGKIESLDMVKTDDNGMSLDLTAVYTDDIDLTDPNLDLYNQDVIDKTGGWVAASIGVRTNRDVLHNIETFKTIKWNFMGEET